MSYSKATQCNFHVWKLPFVAIFENLSLVYLSRVSWINFWVKTSSLILVQCFSQICAHSYKSFIFIVVFARKLIFVVFLQQFCLKQLKQLRSSFLSCPVKTCYTDLEILIIIIFQGISLNCFHTKNYLQFIVIFAFKQVISLQQFFFKPLQQLHILSAIWN